LGTSRPRLPCPNKRSSERLPPHRPRARPGNTRGRTSRRSRYNHLLRPFLVG